MSIQASDLKDYGSANMQETDSGTQGGAIDLTTKIDFTDISAADTIDAVSSAGGDTMNLTITSRDNSGVIQSETLALNGLTPVNFTQTCERVLKVVLGSASAGTVTLTKNTGGATIITLEPGITTVRRPFYNAATPTVGTKIYYEKFFIKNTHATLALTVAQVVEQANPSGKITFGLEGSLNGSDSVTNRVTAPSETLDTNTKNVSNSQNLSPGSAQGVWMALTLAYTDAAAKSTVTFRMQGQST